MLVTIGQRWKKETNLDCLCGLEGGNVVPVQVCTRELRKHKLAHPLEHSRVSDIGAVSAFVGPAGEQGDKLAEGGDDGGPRITSLAERASLVFVRNNGQLDRLYIAGLFSRSTEAVVEDCRF